MRVFAVLTLVAVAVVGFTAALGYSAKDAIKKSVPAG
jgi:hypothetical protein